MLSQHRSDEADRLSSPGELPAEIDQARAQVDRILASDTLRSSEVLRRLLRFLADQTFSGRAGALKEYSVGVDAFGKPPDYDPRQDGSVRLHASRLRQKIEEYYRTEGVNDPLVIELPRGHFKIIWRHNSVVSESVAPVPETAPAMESKAVVRWRDLAIILAAVSVILLCATTWSMLRLMRTTTAGESSDPELDALWRPFISSSRHLIIAVSDPLFVKFERGGHPEIWYRQRDAKEWNQAIGSPEFAALSRALGHPSATASFEYSPRGELIATFSLSQFLSPRRRDISVIKVDQLTWQQFANNDVIFLAPRDIVAEKETSLPVRLAFIADKSGIRNLQPQSGEPETYKGSASIPDNSNGDVFELVSVMPGPLGRTTVASFTGGGPWGVVGAVESLLDPAFARVVIRKLAGGSGMMPKSYQVVVRVRYRDGTPINTSYVTYRALTVGQSSTGSDLR